MAGAIVEVAGADGDGIRQLVLDEAGYLIAIDEVIGDAPARVFGTKVHHLVEVIVDRFFK